jgi:hypothetical protein
MFDDRGGCAAVYLCFASLLSCAVPAAAQTQPDAPTAAEATLKRPTDFRSRIELRHEYQDFAGDANRNLVIPRFEYAASSSVAFRLELPYVFYDPGMQGRQSSDGIGDALVRGSWRALQQDSFALILSTEVIFDTASDETLGMGKTVVAPLIYAALDVPQFNSTFFPNVQHYTSVAGDNNRPDVNFTTLKPNLLTRWPNRFYTFVEPQFIIDWERNADVGFMVEVEVGKLVSSNVAVWVRPGLGVIKNDLPQIYDWNLEVGLRYVF